MNRISYVVAAVALFATTSYAAEPKSGLQSGDKVTAFNPLNVTGSSAGQKVCQV
jgi:hypothetical protein